MSSHLTIKDHKTAAVASKNDDYTFVAGGLFYFIYSDKCWWIPEGGIPHTGARVSAVKPLKYGKLCEFTTFQQPTNNTIIMK